MTLTVSRVNVNGGQLAQSKSEISNYSITYHNKERFSFDYANTLDTFQFCETGSVTTGQQGQSGLSFCPTSYTS